MSAIYLCAVPTILQRASISWEEALNVFGAPVYTSGASVFAAVTDAL